MTDIVSVKMSIKEKILYTLIVSLAYIFYMISSGNDIFLILSKILITVFTVIFIIRMIVISKRNNNNNLI